nr:hypothetical protein [Halalkalibacterium halodurans]
MGKMMKSFVMKLAVMVFLLVGLVACSSANESSQSEPEGHDESGEQSANETEATDLDHVTLTWYMIGTPQPD